MTSSTSSSLRIAVVPVSPLTLDFPSDKSQWKDRYVVCRDSHTLSSNPIPNCCCWLLCCLGMPCCTDQLEKRRGCELFSQYLQKTYSSTALITAEVALSINLADLAQGDGKLTVSMAMNLKNETEKMYTQEFEKNLRHATLFFLSRHPDSSSLEEGELLSAVFSSRDSREIRASIISLPLHPAASPENIEAITEDVTIRLTELDGKGLVCFKETFDRFCILASHTKGFAIKPPSFFKNLHEIPGPDRAKWWNFFCSPGSKEANREGVIRYQAYLEFLFGETAVELAAKDSGGLPLSERTILSLSEAVRLFGRTENFYRRADVFLSYLFNAHGIYASIILFLSHETIGSMTKDRELTDDHIRELHKQRDLVLKQLVHFDIPHMVSLMRLYLNCISPPLPPKKRGEGKAMREEVMGDESISEEILSNYLVSDIFQKIANIPWSHLLTQDESLSIARRVHTKIRGAAISCFQLEELILGELLQHIATRENAKIEDVRLTLITKPTILKRIEQRLGESRRRDFENFKMTLRTVSFEKWTPDLLILLYQNLSGHDRMLSRRIR